MWALAVVFEFLFVFGFGMHYIMRWLKSVTPVSNGISISICICIWYALHHATRYLYYKCCCICNTNTNICIFITAYRIENQWPMQAGIFARRRAQDWKLTCVCVCRPIPWVKYQWFWFKEPPSVIFHSIAILLKHNYHNPNWHHNHNRAQEVWLWL